MSKSYEKHCPYCGFWLDYVIEEKALGYWCHNCEYSADYVRPKEKQAPQKGRVKDEVR